MIRFIIEHRAVAKGRPRFSRGHTYTPKTTVDFEKLVLAEFQNYIKDYVPTEKAISLTVNFYFKLPKKTKFKVGDPVTKRPDLTNILKSIEDGLNGHAYKDDSQIAEIVTRKRYAVEDFIEIAIYELG